MKKYRVCLFFAPACLLLLAASAFSQTPAPKPGQAAPAATSGGELPKPKIAFVNTAAFREGINELKPLYDKLGAELAGRETELSSMRASIDAKQEQIDKNGQKLTAAQVRKLQDEIEQLRKEGQRKLEDYQEYAQKRESELTGPTYGKIIEFLNKYVAEKGITFVFSTLPTVEANLVVYIDPKADITQDFVAAYNKANPATAAANAPGAKPAPAKP